MPIFISVGWEATSNEVVEYVYVGTLTCVSACTLKSTLFQLYFIWTFTDNVMVAQEDRHIEVLRWLPSSPAQTKQPEQLPVYCDTHL